MSLLPSGPSETAVPVADPPPSGCRCALCAGLAPFGRAGEWTAAPDPAVAAEAASALVPAGVAADLPYYVSALLPPGQPKWGSATAGAGAAITYSFMAAVPSYASSEDAYGFAPMTEAQRTAARLALAAWSAVANVTFTEVADGGGGGQIRFGTNNQQGTSAGYAYYPSSFGGWGGDIYIANDSGANITPTPGTYGFKTLVHEIGHALGLKHPGNYNAGGGGTPGPYLPAAEDNNQYTVMAYASHPSLGYAAIGAGPALYDVAAIQYLYGANGQTRTGNDTYSFADRTRAVTTTLWDGGGTDTIDAGAQTLAALIDLRAGAFSSIGSNGSGGRAANNVSIAFGVTIENAVGGGGNDTLIGNDAANLLAGGDGDDILIGGAGNDTLSGGADNDVAVFSKALADYDITRSGDGFLVTYRPGGGDGSDLLTGIELLRFSDRQASLTVPTVRPGEQTVGMGRSLSGSRLLKAGDTAGSAMTAYQLVDTTTGGGYFTLRSVPQAAGATLSVTAAEFSSLRFVGGPAAGTDRISVRAFNGILWSDWTSWDVATSDVPQLRRTLSFQEGGALMALGLALLSDLGSGVTGLRLVELPGGGTVRLADGTVVGAGAPLTLEQFRGLTYTPSSGFSGTAGRFTCAVTRGQDAAAVTTQVSVAVAVTSLADQLAGFDPLVYLASNPDLVAAFGTNTGIARQHFISLGRFEGRGPGRFDPYAYLVENPDLVAAFGVDRNAALRHYITTGIREGRRITGFSAASYLAAYPDLQAAFGSDQAMATLHYLRAGRTEGRTPGFSALSYLAANPDLAVAFGSDEAAGASHYLRFGRVEGRGTSFDAAGYLAANPDLIQAFGDNLQAALRHYVDLGRLEDRELSFDAASYLAANPDLQVAFGSDQAAATLHYIRHGYAERRMTSPAPTSSALFAGLASQPPGGLLAATG